MTGQGGDWGMFVYLVSDSFEVLWTREECGELSVVYIGSIVSVAVW